jgi:cellobiose epimerase
MLTPLTAADRPGDSELAELARRAEAELRGNILPFWLEHVPHPQREGFYGEVVAAGQPREAAPRAALMTSRILWAFSAAYGHYRDPAYRRMADRAYADLTRNFLDPVHGGVFWSITADGEPLQSFKHVYGQVFALYGLAEYHRATGESAAREQAIALFRLIEERARDRRHGGYFESFQRDWQRTPAGITTVISPGPPKSQNTHLHIMEAYSALWRIWPDPQLRQAQLDLVTIMLRRIVDPATAHLGLFFDADWTPRSQEVSYGHDIEFAWLATEAATLLDDPALLAEVRALAVRIADVTLAEGVAADGGIVYEAGPNGLVNPTRQWWVSAEAAVGFLNAYQLSGDPTYLQATLQQWDFIEKYLIDREGGEWFQAVGPDGHVLPRTAKASAWKCPYHNGRACLEIITRARAMLERPGQG